MLKKIRIATRKSLLALWQANYVKAQLEKNHPNLVVELIKITTEGDKKLDTSLIEVGGKGLFIKELEIAMQEGKADIAVHSMKDVPAELPAGFALPVICERADPRDAFISNKYKSLTDLPMNAIVGTSSLRRECQLKALRPDIVTKLLRGNVDTRLQKLDKNEYDAIILAAAGVQRLGLNTKINCLLSTDKFLPAAGQGAIGIECRKNDADIYALLAPLNHPITEQCVIAERAFNRFLNGGCHVPIGALATIEGEKITLSGMVGKPDGSLILCDTLVSDIADAENLGISLAQKLIQQGADKIIQAALCLRQ